MVTSFEKVARLVQPLVSPAVPEEPPPGDWVGLVGCGEGLACGGVVGVGATLSVGAGGVAVAAGRFSTISVGAAVGLGLGAVTVAVGSMSAAAVGCLVVEACNCGEDCWGPLQPARINIIRSPIGKVRRSFI